MTELSEPNENDLKSFRDRLQQKARPSNLSAEMNAQNRHDDSILGQVHLALAKYHEVCRFTDDGVYDKEAARFHLKAAGNQIFEKIMKLRVACHGHESYNTLLKQNYSYFILKLTTFL